MDSVSSKKQKSIWDKIKSGVASTSKAIVRTPAQDRLSRLRNKLAEDQKKLGPNLVQSQRNLCTFVKPAAVVKTAGGKTEKKKSKNFSAQLPAKTTNDFNIKPKSVSERLKPTTEGFDLFRTLESMKPPPTATKTSKNSFDKFEKSHSNISTTAKPELKMDNTCHKSYLSDSIKQSITIPTTCLPTPTTSPKMHRKRKAIASMEVNISEKIAKKLPESSGANIAEKLATKSSVEKLSFCERKSIKKSSANDRLNRLRKSLQKQVDLPSKYPFENPAPNQMDVDEEMPLATNTTTCDETKNNSFFSSATSFFQNLRKEIKNVFGSYTDIKENYLNVINGIQSDDKASIDCIYIVPDTNIFIHHLTFVKDIVDKLVENNTKTKIYVPYVVIEELDRLKEQKDKSVSILAMRAIKYLNEKLENRDEGVCGQSVVESMDKSIPTKFADDSILNCCLQLKKKGFRFILLSNDINLRNKALVNSVKAFASADVDLTNVSKYL